MISFEAILLLMSALMTGRLLSAKFLYPMIQAQGHIVFFDLLFFFAFIAIVWLTITGRRFERQRFFVIFGVCTLAIIILLTRQWITRSAADNPFGIQDGAIQTQEAARFLQRGVNPYAADYTNTDFGKFPSPHGPGTEHVANTHFVYPPLNVLLALPIVWWQDHGGIIDVSLTYTLALFATVIILVWLAPSWDIKSRITLLTLGNPFVWFYPVAGFNDILMVLCLVVAVATFQTKHWKVAGLFFGLALAAKQTAWVLGPLWLAYIWIMYTRRRITKRQMFELLGSVAVITALIYGPFLLWNAPALYDDLVRYLSGTIPGSYPIAGSTTLQYLRVWGWLHSPWDPFPTAVVQALVGIPAIALGIVWIKRQTTATQLLSSSVVIILALLLFSRFFFENYTSALVVLAVAAYAFSQHEQVSASP